MKFPRRLAGLAVVALLGVGILAPGAAAAQGSASALKVFNSPRFGYMLSYPATWHRATSANLDLLLLAPDSGARLGGLGMAAAVSTADLRQLADTTINQLSSSTTKVSHIAHSTRVIHGVPFQVDQATISVSGVTEQAMTLGASVHKRTFLFFGIVAVAVPSLHAQAPHGKEELSQLQAAFASIIIR